MATPVEISVPAGTVAVVMLSWTDGGGFEARFAESRTAVPPTRSLIVDALLRIAVALDDQRQVLDEASRGDRNV